MVHRDDICAMLEMADVLVPVPLHRSRELHRGFNQAEVMAQRISKLFNSPGRKAGDRLDDDVDTPTDPRPAGSGYQGNFKFGRSPKLPVVNAGVRIRVTETQTHLPSRTQRTENLRGAFVLSDPASLKDKHIVLVDDVMTTGATLVSFARTLKHANPASISAILLAVADPKGRAFEVI